MAQRRNLAPEELADATAPAPNLALARTLSIIFSPPLMIIGTYLLIAYIQPAPIAESIRWVLLTLLLQMGPGMALYAYRRRSGAYSDADVSVRQDRNELYLVNLFWKISMHASTIGAFATVTSLLSPSGGIVVWACALAVGWARVRTRNHTLMQVLAGLVASALITLGAFTLVAER
jgi:membrane-associated phospholipid phosphatase